MAEESRKNHSPRTKPWRSSRLSGELSFPPAATNTEKPGSATAPGSILLLELSLDDLAALDAAGAHADLLVAAVIELGLHRAQIDVPAPAGDVVRVRDVVAELRTLAADFTNLSHDKLQNLNCSRRPGPCGPSRIQVNC